MNAERFKTQIKILTIRKRVEEKFVDLFVSEVLRGIDSGWSQLSPLIEALEISLNKEYGLIGEDDFNETLKDLKKEATQLNETAKTALKSSVEKTKEFRALVESYFHLDNKINLEKFSNLEVLKAKDFFSQFYQSVLEFEKALTRDLNNISLHDGRKQIRKEDKFTLVREVFSLSHCLLGIKGSITNSDTVFIKILRACYDLLDIKDNEFAHYIRPCFEDHSTIYNMAFTYKRHNRLDLYIEHVHKTSEAKEIYDVFHSDWDTWERPSNFNLLTS